MGIPSQIKLSAKPALVKDGGSHARLLASGYQLHQLRQPIDHTSAARADSSFDCLRQLPPPPTYLCHVMKSAYDAGKLRSFGGVA